MVFVEAKEDVRHLSQVGVDDGHRGVELDPQAAPGDKARIPQEREVGTGEIDVADELLGIREVVLGAKPDDLDGVYVGRSKLLDRIALGATRRSMGRIEPQQHRSVAGDRGSDVGDGAATHVEHFVIKDAFRRAEVVDVGGCGFAGCVRLGGIGGSATGTGAGQQAKPEHRRSDSRRSSDVHGGETQRGRDVFREFDFFLPELRLAEFRFLLAPDPEPPGPEPPGPEPPEPERRRLLLRFRLRLLFFDLLPLVFELLLFRRWPDVFLDSCDPSEPERRGSTGSISGGAVIC